jgi:hypothetical protein
MQKKVVIRTPFPTAEDLAEVYGISKTRMRKLTALADEIIGKDSTKSRSTGRNVKRKTKTVSRA